MTLPRPAKRRPRASKKRPRGAPEAPRDAQERPKAGQVTFKRYPREPHTLPKWSLASPKMNFQHDLCGQLCSKGFWSDLVSFFGLCTKLAICKKPRKSHEKPWFPKYAAKHKGFLPGVKNCSHTGSKFRVDVSARPRSFRPGPSGHTGIKFRRLYECGLGFGSVGSWPHMRSSEWSYGLAASARKCGGLFF